MISLCKKMMKIINSNITSSLILNFTAMSLAIIGIVEPITGALIHNIGSVIVIVYLKMREYLDFCKVEDES